MKIIKNNYMTKTLKNKQMLVCEFASRSSSGKPISRSPIKSVQMAKHWHKTESTITDEILQCDCQSDVGRVTCGSRSKIKTGTACEILKQERINHCGLTSRKQLPIMRGHGYLCFSQPNENQCCLRNIKTRKSHPLRVGF